MAKKQVLTTPTSVSGAAPARAVSRSRTTKHSKATVPAVTAVVADEPQENPAETIARTAYGYWEARGFQGGDPLQDWVRAEEEYRRLDA